jgi:hypothetical protein
LSSYLPGIGYEEFLSSGNFVVCCRYEEESSS